MSIPSSINKDGVIAEQAVLNRLSLNGTEVTDIATELTNDTPRTALVAVPALDNTLRTLEKLANQLDTSSSEHQEQTVMSISLVDQYFNIPGQFSLENWIIETNALYGLSGSGTNYARVENSVYSKPGNYTASITISSLPSGFVNIYFNDQLLRKVNEAGTYSVEFTLTDIINDRFYIATEDLNPEDRVVVTSFAIYFITSRFYTYLVNKVKSMATVDVSDFVSWTRFWEEMKVYADQFEASANLFVDRMDEHEAATNPHNITIETIGAASANHTHDQYVNTDVFRAELASEIAKCALKDHVHDDRYAKLVDIPFLVEDVVGTRFNEVMTIPPANIVLAPVGRLPSRFMRTEISEPLTILLPSQLNPVVNSNYSAVYGIVITNSLEIVEDASLIFLLGSDGATLPVDYDYAANPLIFQLRFHAYRKVSGYKIYSATGEVRAWKVYSGNNTFMHQINELSPDQTYYFDEPIPTNGLTFALLEADADVTGFKIEVIMDQQDLDAIYICKDAFTLSIPDKGANRLVTRSQTSTETKLEVENIADNIPCFIMGEYAYEDIRFNTTWIRPEYGETRIGVEVFTDNFNELEADPEELFETYKHPTLGTLRLLEGSTLQDGHPLTTIYNKSYDSWYTTASTRKVVIEHEIAEDNVILRGYLMNWREPDAHRIPDTWTVQVEGVDELGRTTTVIVDSVENYFPCYSAEDDDIVFTKSCTLNMHIRKVILTMVAGENNTEGLGINQFTLYFSKYYYSIPENTMYKGLEKTPSLCLGYYRHMPYSGWVPTNLCLGKTVVVPLNDLDITEPSTEYVVPNPFLSVNITVNISIYRWMDNQTTTGNAQVVGISDTEIRVLVMIPATYCLTVTRRW